MTDHPHSLLPHHRLVAYGVSLEFLRAVLDARISDVKLRDEAERAAKGTCLNLAEGAGRATRADKARAYAIARGELIEAIEQLRRPIAAEIPPSDSDAHRRTGLVRRACGAEEPRATIARIRVFGF